jgi:N-formylglutamate amidohydrolase
MPAFEIVAGGPRSPHVLPVPHASTHVPDDARASILLDDDELRDELVAMTDAHTDAIVLRAADACDVRPWAFVNRVSRLAVDPERFPDPAAEEMEAVGMGPVYTSTSHGLPLRAPDDDVRERLLATYFRPYADALADLVDERLAACGRALVVDVHSYPASRLPYELHPADRRPPLCLGTDPVHTPARLVSAARSAFAGWGIELDQPFRGTYVPMRHYGQDTRVSAIMLEIRRDQYLLAHGAPDEQRIAALAAAAAQLVSAA